MANNIDELANEIAKNCKTQEDFTEFFKQLKQRGLEAALSGELEGIYGTAVSPTLISNVTDAVLADVRAWQTRPLDRCFPIVYLDCIVVKVKTDKGIDL